MIDRKRAETGEEDLRPSKYPRRKDGINVRDHDDPTDSRAEAAHNDD